MMISNHFLALSRVVPRTLPTYSFSTKIPRKKASFLMNELRTAQTATPLPYPKFSPGDAIEVHMLASMTSTKPQIMRGVVIAKVNRGIDSSFIIRDVLHGDIIERRITTRAPLVQKIIVLQKAFIHQGKKRVRRAKLYYLREKDPLICKVSTQ